MSIVNIFANFRAQKSYVAQNLPIFVFCRRGPESTVRFQPFPLNTRFRKVYIAKQYKKRKLLFKNNLLPDFDLKTIKAVTSFLDEKTEFKTWFDALDSMKKQMDQIDYDIALIGCGAYGFNLAAHAKKSGKKSVHLGGALQILFGIIGSRFENPIVGDGIYLKLFNEHWVRPSNEERPKSHNSLESGAYW